MAAAAQSFKMIVVVVCVVGGLLLLRLHQKGTNAFCKSKQRLDGKVALVTGGTTGIGKEIAIDFAKRGAKVYIACPFQNEGNEARESIIKQSGNNNIIFKHLDLGSFKSTRIFVEYLKESEEKLDILVNNAGGVFDFLTEDGFNATIQVNYLGHYLLTLLLLPLLKKSESGRVVNVASIMHWFAYLDFKSFSEINHWHKVQSYSNSKLCLILFTKELSKRLKGSGITVNCLHPGFVGTKIYQSVFYKFAIILVWIICAIFKTPKEGAQTAIYLAVDEEVAEKSGNYYVDCKKTFVSWIAKDEEKALKLWEHSRMIVKLKDDEVTL